MQTVNVKKIANQELMTKVVSQALVKNTEDTKANADNAVELTKSQRFSRLLEANSDCV